MKELSRGEEDAALARNEVEAPMEKSKVLHEQIDSEETNVKHIEGLTVKMGPRVDPAQKQEGDNWALKVQI